MCSIQKVSTKHCSLPRLICPWNSSQCRSGGWNEDRGGVEELMSGIFSHSLGRRRRLEGNWIVKIRVQEVFNHNAYYIPRQRSQFFGWIEKFYFNKQGRDGDTNLEIFNAQAVICSHRNKCGHRRKDDKYADDKGRTRKIKEKEKLEKHVRKQMIQSIFTNPISSSSSIFSTTASSVYYILNWSHTS